jgi:hypothetical protein
MENALCLFSYDLETFAIFNDMDNIFAEVVFQNQPFPTNQIIDLDNAIILQLITRLKTHIRCFYLDNPDKPEIYMERNTKFANSLISMLNRATPEEAKLQIVYSDKFPMVAEILGD